MTRLFLFNSFTLSFFTPCSSLLISDCPVCLKTEPYSSSFLARGATATWNVLCKILMMFIFWGVKEMKNKPGKMKERTRRKDLLPGHVLFCYFVRYYFSSLPCFSQNPTFPSSLISFPSSSLFTFSIPWHRHKSGEQTRFFHFWSLAVTLSFCVHVFLPSSFLTLLFRFPGIRRNCVS